MTHQAFATRYVLSGQPSCIQLSGSWNPLYNTCAISGLWMDDRDSLAVGSGLVLEDTGVITNNGGTIYVNGTLALDEFSVLYNNQMGSVYNSGTLTSSGGTINNYASIHNEGAVLNYGTVYNYGTISNGGTLDDRYGITHNNGTIWNCGGTVVGLPPYGNPVKQACPYTSTQNPVPSPSRNLAQTAAPLRQQISGIPAANTVCGRGLELIIKTSDGSPACVRPATLRVLIERGWGHIP